MKGKCTRKIIFKNVTDYYEQVDQHWQRQWTRMNIVEGYS
jgi:hypothetical protein